MYSIAMLLSGLLACTQMEDAGQPLKPVQPVVQPIAPPTEKSPPPAEGLEKSPTKEEPKTEKQEEDLFTPKDAVIVVSQKEATPTKEADPAIEEPENPSLSSQEDTSTSTPTQPTTPLAPQTPATGSFEAVTQWPLRLVKTEMQLNPPRAILGLPSGEEIVIRSGSFIEEYNLVVMGIGTRTVSLAKVHPQGDHARIEPIHLYSLND